MTPRAVQRPDALVWAMTQKHGKIASGAARRARSSPACDRNDPRASRSRLEHHRHATVQDDQAERNRRGQCRVSSRVCRHVVEGVPDGRPGGEHHQPEHHDAQQRPGPPREHARPDRGRRAGAPFSVSGASDRDAERNVRAAEHQRQPPSPLLELAIADSAATEADVPRRARRRPGSRLHRQIETAAMGRRGLGHEGGGGADFTAERESLQKPEQRRRWAR